MDLDKRRALSDFYREEFLKHLEHMRSNGIVHDGNHEIVQRACSRLISDLDRVCWRDGFPEVAATLLQNFDALTGLSGLDSRPAH